MARWIRRLSLAVGFPLVVLLLALLVVGGLRFLQVKLFYSPRSPERMAEKRAYLDAVPVVDPARATSFVVIFFDDLGWGDLSVQGNRLIATPRIDRAAAEGLRMTHFYAAAPVCTPSRAALLTGRYPVRAGVDRHVFFPDASPIGRVNQMLGWGNELVRDEILLPEVLRAAGYRTGMVGKWHLGGREGHRPNDFGFDSWLGVLWSNDMYPLHLYRDGEIVQRDERPPAAMGEHDEEKPLGPGGVDQSTLTERYTDEAIAFLEQSRDEPFFLYVAHTFPHVPHYPSQQQAGRSEGGVYGDVVEDLDRSTGRILDALARLGLEERTLVVITSDNGADYGGSPGPLRGRKGEILEGGQRVPMIVRWPGRVEPGRVSAEMAMNVDLFPTFLELAGLELPSDRVVDGRSLLAHWEGAASGPHERLYYFPVLGRLPGAVRDDRFKYLLDSGDKLRARPHLTRLDLDAEAHDLRRKHPERAARLAAALEAMRREIDENPRGWR